MSYIKLKSKFGFYRVPSIPRKFPTYPEDTTTAPAFNNRFSNSSEGFRKVRASTLVTFNGGRPRSCKVSS